MKNFVINGSINLIKKNNSLSNEKIEEIKYGLLSIYLTISKTVIILLISLLLHIFWETIMFIFIYNIIRLPSFGLHATKSWICLVSSSLIFIGIPLFCLNISLPINIKFIISVICVILLTKNSPADTYKRPIINRKKRTIYKRITFLLAMCYFTVVLICKSDFISNMFLFAMIVQSLVTAPTIYKLFKLPYDNYKNY